MKRFDGVMSENAKEFLIGLSELMEKHKIEITASDEWGGYAECGEDIQIRIESKGLSTEYFSIPFGGSLDETDIVKLLEEIK